MDERVIYSPLKIECKSVPNAVKVGSEVVFSIFVNNAISVNTCKFVSVFEKTDEVFWSEMEFVSKDEETSKYSIKFTPSNTGLYFYFFEVFTDSCVIKVGKDEFNESYTTDENPNYFQMTVYNREFKEPKWLNGGIMYQIFVDRFNSVGEVNVKGNAKLHSSWEDCPVFTPNSQGIIENNDFFGGNLKGIIAKLSYLKRLNVTCIYLNPIFEAASNHKYDTGDYMKIDSMFGTEEDFSELCDKAKKLGIRIILDGVFSHVGDDSIYFNKYSNYFGQGAYQSKDSPYYDWFKFKSYPYEYDSWWGINTLPEIDEANENFIEFVCGENGVVAKWLEKGASGFRLDVADELKEVFIEKLTERAKSVQSDSVVIGEVWEDASNKISYGERRHYFEGKQLDSVMNYPLKNGIIDFVKTGNHRELLKVVNSIYDNYPFEVLNCLMNILGTHDTVRILTELQDVPLSNMRKSQKAEFRMSRSARCRVKKKIKMASLLQFTMFGVPCIYYGDEVGMEGYEDPLNRLTFPWGMEDREILEWYVLLGNIRRTLVAFENGFYKTIYCNDGVFVFERISKDQKATVVVNCGKEDYTFKFNGNKRDFISGKRYDESITVGSYEGAVIV